MRSKYRLGLILLLAMTGAACGEDDPSTDPGMADGGGTTATDAGTTTLNDGATTNPGRDGGRGGVDSGTTAGPGGTRLVFAVSGGSSVRYVATATIDDEGMLSAPEKLLDLDEGPRGVAISPDGSEAIVAFGLSPSANEGVAIISLDDDPASPQFFRFGTSYSTSTVSYVSQDEAVVGLFGPDGGALVTLSRGSGGSFAASEPVVVEAMPRLIAPLPNHPNRALLLRSNLLAHENEASLQIIGPDTAGWGLMSDGPALPKAPLDFAVDATRVKVYVPLYDPTDPPSPTPGSTDTRRGLLHRFSTSGGLETLAVDGEPLVIPVGGLLMALSPDGSTAVVASNETGLGRTGLTTITGLDGTPEAIGEPSGHVPSTFVQDLVLVRSDLLVVGAAATSGGVPLSVWKRNSDGAWDEVDAATLAGSVSHIAVVTTDSGPI